jgi:methylphosphotriester-DNA--protein-cysteine methyltransferase
VSDSWTLTDPDGSPYQSDCPGVVGGHRRSKIYGRLECRSARQALARGGYARNRVFFLDEHAAQAAGYRPCAVCLPAQYAAWKTARPALGRGAQADDDGGGSRG